MDGSNTKGTLEAEVGEELGGVVGTEEFLVLWLRVRGGGGGEGFHFDRVLGY